MATVNSRDYFFDALKGLAIIAVIFIHTDYIPPSNNSILPCFIRHFFTFAVNLFFFCSGYFTKPEPRINLKRLKRLLFPYIIWSIPFIAWSWWHGSYSFTAWKIFMILFFGAGFPILYFLSVLMQLTLIHPCIVKMLDRKKWYVDGGCLLLTPLYILFVYIIFFHHNEFTWFHVLFPGWFSFYYLGMMFRRDGNPIKMHEVTLIGLWIASCFIFMNETSWLLGHSQPILAVTQLSFSSFLYSFLLIAVVMKLWKKDYPDTFLGWVGHYSFGIFLLHLPLKRFIVFSLLRLGVPQYGFGIMMTLTVILTLFASLAVILSIKRIFPSWAVRILGLT